MLHVFDPDLLSYILVDTSDFAFGAILEQKHPSGWHPEEYFFKCLYSTEGN